MTLKSMLPEVRRNVSLKPYTTLKIGGPAKYFFAARTKEDVPKAIKAARKLNLPFFILGAGSNVLVADKGFNGLVIRLQAAGCRFQGTKLYAEAGTPFSVLVHEAGKRGLAGLEWAGGLPGTLGGAVRGNAGAFGGEVKDSIISVETLDKNLRPHRLSKAQCQFKYRSSIFKERGWIVLAVTMALRKGNGKEIQEVAREHMEYRKQRSPLEYPNAGSVFENCDVKKAPRKTADAFKEKIKKDPFPVIPIAAVIAEAGLKGKKIGGAQVSEKHPNFIINRKRAKERDVSRLISFVKKKVKGKFGILPQEEIQRIG